MTVHLCPSLGSDPWLSGQLFLEDLVRAFRALPGAPRIEVTRPPTTPGEPRWRRQYCRYVAYPRLIHGIRDPQAVIHVLDHSYGHLCRVRPRHTIVTCHDLSEFRVRSTRGVQFALWRFRVASMRRARRIVTVSEQTRRDVIRFLGVAPERVITLHSGADPFFRALPDARALGQAFRAARGLAPETWLFLHVGTNILRKNIPTLLRALGRLRSEGLPFRLVKIGRPLLTSPHAGLVAACGLADRVIDLGRVSADTLLQTYNLADVFLFPSLLEGFGRPILEAQACGLPAVLADSSCLREIGGDGALYHEPEDDAGLAAAIRALVSDAGLRRQLAAAGAVNVRRFSWARHCEGLVRLYAEVAAG